MTLCYSSPEKLVRLTCSHGPPGLAQSLGPHAIARNSQWKVEVLLTCHTGQAESCIPCTERAPGTCLGNSNRNLHSPRHPPPSSPKQDSRKSWQLCQSWRCWAEETFSTDTPGLWSAGENMPDKWGAGGGRRLGKPSNCPSHLEGEQTQRDRDQRDV